MIELMIVVAVLGILLAMALPTMKEMVMTFRVRNAASDFYSLLLKSRSDAIKRGGDVTIAASGAGWIASAGGTMLMSIAPLPNGVSLKLCPSTATQITYSSSGRASGGRIRVRLYSTELSQQAPSARQIDIDAGGLPRIRTITHAAAASSC